MSANIRRLVFSAGPLWRSLIPFLFVLVAIADFLWLTSARGTRWMLSPPLLPALWMSVLPLIIQRPIWRLLPVSELEIGRTLWWGGAGAPLVMLFAIMAGAFGLAQTIGHNYRSLADATALLAGQYVLWAVGPLMLMATIAATRLLGTYGLLIFPLGALAIAIIGGNLTFKPELRLFLYAGGLGAVVMAAVLHQMAESWPRRLVIDIKTLWPGRSNADSADRGSTGWRVLLPTYVRVVGFVLVVQLLGTLALNWMEAGGEHVIVSLMTMFAVMSMILVRVSIRSLSGLPISRLQLTTALQFCAVLTLVLIGGMLFGVRLLTGAGVGQAPVVLALLAGLGALSMPFGMWAQNPANIGVGMAVPIMMATLPAFLPTSAAGSLVLIGVGLGSMVVGWLWTYRELSTGRHTYRASLWAPLTWRGRGEGTHPI